MKFGTWISVEEQMPEVSQPVLVCYENTCRDDLIIVAWFRDHLWWTSYEKKEVLSKTYDHVTHWMPLPNPPEGKG